MTYLVFAAIWLAVLVSGCVLADRANRRQG